MDPNKQLDNPMLQQKMKPRHLVRRVASRVSPRPASFHPGPPRPNTEPPPTANDRRRRLDRHRSLYRQRRRALPGRPRRRPHRLPHHRLHGPHDLPGHRRNVHPIPRLRWLLRPRRPHVGSRMGFRVSPPTLAIPIPRSSHPFAAWVGTTFSVGPSSSRSKSPPRGSPSRTGRIMCR
jgi:hypothetical protein